MITFKSYRYVLRDYFFVIINYFSNLTLQLLTEWSLLGFILFLTIGNQLISGTMLSFSVVLEPMIIPIVREEEDTENLYIDDFFWLHERGVDLFFLTLVLHLLRKLYIRAFSVEQALAWKSGVILFLIGHGVIFFGLVLCCTHLSEITLTIAANILHTIFFFKGKMYWWLFTDMFLNTDTTIRLAYIHYILAFFLTYYGITHAIEMHYDWRGLLGILYLEFELSWWFEGFLIELGAFIKYVVLIKLISIQFYEEPEALTYEIFMWGDVGLVTDIRFYGVAPHWYFRPYMAWLIVCPYHKLGLAGLGFFFVVLYFQPNLNVKYTLLNVLSVWYIIFFFLFLVTILYTSSFLPYGRFFNQLGGNIVMLEAYLGVYAYLGTTTIISTILYICRLCAFI